MKKPLVWIVLIVVIGVCVYKANEFNENYKKGMSRVKYVPPHENATIDEVEKKIGDKLTITKKENIIFGVAEEPMGIYMGSGPPVYIFDENNTLIDYTLDRGDDLKFRRRWYIDKKGNSTEN